MRIVKSVVVALSVGALRVRATTECRKCIPLEDLTHPAHGISISSHGLSSAVHHHNGTTHTTGSLPPSEVYQSLLRRWEAEADGDGLRNPWPRKDDPVSLSSPFPRWRKVLRLLTNSWEGDRAPLNTTDTTISDEARLFCHLFNNLKANSDLQGIPMQNIGISVPIWMTDSQASHLFPAAECAQLSIRDIVHDTAATAASQGMALCRVSSEYLPCESQGRHIMTLDLSLESLVMASHIIRQGIYLWQPRRYIISHDLTHSAYAGVDGDDDRDLTEKMTYWIDSFAADGHVDKLFLIGPLADDEILREAVRRSKISDSLEELKDYQSSQVVAAGTARLAKETMESQDTDCTEPPSCEEIRKEADKVAGRASVSGHVEL